MTASNLVILFVIAFWSAVSVRGATWTSKQSSFAIDIPESWSQVAAPTNILFVARSADMQKELVVVAAEGSEAEREQALAGTRQGAKDQGMEIISTPETTVGGVVFRGFNGRIGEKIMIAVRCGSFNNRVYLLQGMHQAGRAAIDSQLQGVLNSFRLVQQTTSSPRVEPEKQVLNLGQRAEVIGKVVGYLLGIGAVVWMWRRRSASAGD
jgi:hypothetical protein